MAKETETALVVLEPTTALVLAAIKKIVAEFTPDTATAKGRAEIASIAHKVARSKTYLDGIGKDLVDQYKEIPKKIDANRKRIRDELDALKDEVRRPLTEWEEAEEARVKAENERRAADLAHREGIYRAMFDALKSHGIPANHADDVVSLISTGSIPFVEVVY